MNVMLMNNGGRFTCQSTPSLPGDPRGRTIEFAPTPASAVNAIKEAVSQTQRCIQVLQFISLTLQPMFAPQPFWIHVLTPYLRGQDQGTNPNHAPGHNTGGELRSSMSRVNPIPDNCHPAVRQWASLANFFSGWRMIGSEVDFLRCTLPGGSESVQRFQMHLMYIWGGPVLSVGFD